MSGKRMRYGLRSGSSFYDRRSQLRQARVTAPGTTIDWNECPHRIVTAEVYINQKLSNPQPARSAPCRRP